MSLSNQSPQNSLAEFSLKIESYNIDAKNLTEFLVDFNLFNTYISGRFKIESEFNIAQGLEKDTDKILEIYAKDIGNNEYKDKFVVYDITSINTEPMKFITTGRFYDFFSFSLLKKYCSKIFKNANFETILKDSKIASDIIKNYDKKTFDFKDTETLEYFTIAGNENVMKSLGRFKEVSNSLFFHTHDKVKTRSWENLFNDDVLKISGENQSFVYPTTQASPIFDIKEYEGNYLNLFQRTQTPKTKYFKFDIKNLSKKPETFSGDDFTRRFGEVESFKSITDGERLEYYPSLNFNNRISNDYYDLLDSNFQNIFVTGLFSNNVGSVCNMIFRFDDKNFEKVTGNYLITRVVDYIEQGSINQRIELSRIQPPSK